MAYMIELLSFSALKEILYHMVQSLEMPVASLDGEITSKQRKLILLPQVQQEKGETLGIIDSDGRREIKRDGLGSI